MFVLLFFIKPYVTRRYPSAYVAVEIGIHSLKWFPISTRVSGMDAHIRLESNLEWSRLCLTFDQKTVVLCVWGLSVRINPCNTNF